MVSKKKVFKKKLTPKKKVVSKKKLTPPKKKIKKTVVKKSKPSSEINATKPEPESNSIEEEAELQLPEPKDLSKPEPSQSREKYMTLGEHLEDLRQVLIKGFMVLSVFVLVSLIFGEQIHKILTRPYKSVLGEDAIFYQIKLMAPFMIYIKTSFILSLLITFPFQLYFIWTFVSPAVDPKKEKYGKIVILFSTLLFWAGIALCWLTAFEKVLHFFLVVFQPGDIETKLPIDEYYDIFFNLHLLFGISFQLPVVLVLLGRIGILSSSFLLKFWREVTMVLVLLSAFLSPPDLISLFLLFVPMLVLFFASIGIMRFFEKKGESL